MLFEWYYPDNIKVLGTALKIWGHDPDVSTPIIKCKLFFQTLGFRLFLQIITSRYDRTASKSISATSVWSELTVWRSSVPRGLCYAGYIWVSFDTIFSTNYFQRIYPDTLEKHSTKFNLLSQTERNRSLFQTLTSRVVLKYDQFRRFQALQWQMPWKCIRGTYFDLTLFSLCFRLLWAYWHQFHHRNWLNIQSWIARIIILWR